MEIRIEKLGRVIAVHLGGDMDHDAFEGKRDQVISAIFEADRPALLMDFTDVKSITSTGLGFLISMYKHVCSRGGDFGLMGLTSELRELLALTGLDQIIEIHDSPEAFRAAVG